MKSRRSTQRIKAADCRNSSSLVETTGHEGYALGEGWPKTETPVRTALTVLVLFCLLSWSPANSQTAPANSSQENRPVVRLEPGKPIEKTLAGGGSDSYEIQVGAGQFLHAVVDQLGIDVVLSLYGPDGKPIATMDSPNGAFGLEQISTITERPGFYRLEVASVDKNVPAGRYRATVNPLRVPSDQDRECIAAERAFYEAEQLQAQGSADSSRGAIQKFEATLPLWHAAADDYEEALTLASIGSSEASLGEKQKALDYFNQALPLERALGDRSGEADTLNNIGQVFYTLSEKQKALDYYNQALLLQRVVGDHAGVATTLNNIGVVHSALGENQKALDCYNQALPLLRAAGDRRGEATLLFNFGQVYNILGEKQKALDYYNQALTLRRVVGDRAGEATTLNNIGTVYTALGEKQKALDYCNQALPLERAMSDRTAEASTLSNIGQVYFTLREYQKALDYFNQALPLTRTAGDHHEEATTLSTIGQIYSAFGEKQKALDYFNQALALRRAIGDRRGEAVTLNSIGLVYSDLGEKQKALDYFNQALPLTGAADESREEAATLNNIGLVYSALGEKQKALDNFNQSLPLERTAGDRREEAATLNNIGQVYSALGEKQKALDYYNQALSRRRVVDDRRGEAVTLNNIGLVYFTLGEKELGLENFSEALALAREVQNPLVEAAVLSNLMAFWRDEGQPALAVFFGKEAVNKVQQLRASISGLEEETRQSFLKSKERTYRYLADLLITQGRLPEAQQVLDLLKNEEYFEFIRRDDKDVSSLTAPVNLTRSEQALNREYEENVGRVTAVGNEWAALRSKPSRTPEEEKHLVELSDQLKSANDAWEKFLSGLYVELGKSKEAQTTVENVQESASGMQRVVRQLTSESGPGVVALYTLVGDEKYRVLVVTPTVMVAREYPIKAEDLRKKVFEFRQSLVNPWSDPVPKAQELYRILVGPVAQDLAGAKAEMLMWSLDDVLRYLPMAALHDGHQYLVEKYTNEVFTPASVASLTERPNVNGWRGLGMGVSKSYGEFSALPSVPEELHRVIRDKDISGVSGVLPGKTMLDETFTEDAMKKALEQNYPLVHIASHFAFAPGNETNSFLLLGGKDPQGEHLSLAEIRKDPAFSFADTELLTLSACNTAVSGPAGDGREVDGLGILAQQKGARAVVASLWGVYDPSTGVLMQEFYELWMTHPGITKAEALREAQLALLHGTTRAVTEASATDKHSARPGYAHPFYWAPFILIGNWR